MVLNPKYTKEMPVEVVNMVIDFIDDDKHNKIAFEKHYKPAFECVLDTLEYYMDTFPPNGDDNIIPSVAVMCFGNGKLCDLDNVRPSWLFR